MSIPANIIIAWSGAINEIPSGWVLCDGTNNTPDLRNRFIVSAGDLYNFEDIGGSADATLVSHTHSATTSTVGNHGHSFPRSNAAAFLQRNAIGVVGAVGGGVGTSSVSHSHTVTTDLVGQDGTNKNLPPYFALAFIMKEAE